MRCNECNNEMIFKATDIDSCWGDYKVTVRGLDAYVCPKCGNLLLPAKTVKILEDISRGYAEAEKQIAEKDEELNSARVGEQFALKCCSEAKKQLAEKDKEIARLKTIKNARQFNKTQSIVEEFEKKLRKDKVLFTFNSKEMSQHDATVRHQICEEIKRYILCCDYNDYLEIEINPVGFHKFLDKIQKGEKI